jgi:hypothetical protein
VKRKKPSTSHTTLRDLTVIVVVAAASFTLAIGSDHIYLAAVFAAQAVAAAVLAVRIGKAPCLVLRQGKVAVSGSEQLILKRASASRSTGHWSDDDYGVLAEGAVVRRILKHPPR